MTVYCSSSDALAPRYVDVAERFGALLARSGRTLVYGAGSVGLMGAVARACRAEGGRVVGVITERLRDAELMDPLNSENIVVRTMRERKALLEARGDAMVVLPGGLGTLEEFFEILVGRLLGEHDLPIVVVNTSERAGGPGYYDPMLAMFDHMISGGFARPGVRTLFTVCAEPEDAIAELELIAGDLGRVRGAAWDDDLLPARSGRGGG